MASGCNVELIIQLLSQLQVAVDLPNPLNTELENSIIIIFTYIQIRKLVSQKNIISKYSLMKCFFEKIKKRKKKKEKKKTFCQKV